jgi:hypothetical protein
VIIVPGRGDRLKYINKMDIGALQSAIDSLETNIGRPLKDMEINLAQSMDLLIESGRLT